MRWYGLILLFLHLMFGELPLARDQDISSALQVPDPYIERTRRAASFLELSVNDAIRLALTNNLEIEIENYNEELNRQKIVGTRGFFDPVVAFTVGWNSSQRPNTRSLDAGRNILVSLNKRWVFNTSLQQNVPLGGTLSISFDNSRSTTNDSFTFINPSWGSGFILSFNQPLWRGFRETSTRRQLRLHNLDSRISDSQFQQRVAEIIQQVENQYWELFYAIDNYEARRRSLQLAIIQHQNNEKRVEIGVLAPIEITSSHAESATREQEMIQSEVQIISSQNALKRLLAPEPNAPIWDLSLIPLDQPQVQAPTISLQSSIQTALRNRPELDQIRLQIERNEIDRTYFRKEGKPRVNLNLSVSSNGTAGAVADSTVFLDTDGDGIPEPIFVPGSESPFAGDFWDAANQSVFFDFPNYSVFFDVEIPLRNRSNNAQLDQLAITERQLNSRYRSQQQAIVVEVRNAYESIATQKKRMDAAIVATRLSEEQLDGENKRFEAGLSTNFEVLRLQRDLADAQVRELRARIDYQLAVTALQTAMFTILDENDILLAKRD